jgi:hypothetical protein
MAAHKWKIMSTEMYTTMATCQIRITLIKSQRRESRTSYESKRRKSSGQQARMREREEREGWNRMQEDSTKKVGIKEKAETS